MTYPKINGEYRYCGYGTNRECKCPKGLPVCKTPIEKERRQREEERKSGGKL